jgi:hypothetical protein
MEVTFDPCAGVVVVPSSGSEEELASVDAALAMWSAVAPVRLSRDVSAGFRPLPLTFRDAPAAIRGVYDDESGIVYVNADIEDRRARAITVAHELGHAFGLFHVEERESVMNRANTEIAPNASDAASIRALWPACRGDDPPPTSASATPSCREHACAGVP